jgi:hypothetical protein
MSLTLPGADELDDFSHQETDRFDEDQKDFSIQQAADLLFIATGLDEDPTDARTARIVNYAILAMSWKLLDVTDNTTEINSPFQSETIGSYSYSKMMAAISTGQITGVAWFDIAVKFLLGGTDDSGVWYKSENVFEQPFNPNQGNVTYLPDVFGR